MGGWSQVLLSKIMSIKEADDYSIIMCEKLLNVGWPLDIIDVSLPPFNP